MKTIDMNRLTQEVSEKKRYLAKLVADPIETIASNCEYWLDNVELLDGYLQQAIEQLPYCTLLYVSDNRYQQLSSNISKAGTDTRYRQQNLSQRPYLQSTVPLKGMVLSDIYQDNHNMQSCITLVQAIQRDGELLGLVIADFNLQDLPLPNDFSRIITNWQQFKGDPAIRGSLFSQQRTHSLMDKSIHKVHATVQRLMIQNGVFHFKLHYSSSRITLWLYDRPHHYCLHNVEDLLDNSIFDHYPQRPYPEDATVAAHALGNVLNQFHALRFADENIYLRSASVNVINGMVGLTFSCDGSHYIPIDEFIKNSMEYWIGSLKTA